jgi:hypothetical protein
MEQTTIAVDLAKSVFQVAVSNRPGRVDEERRRAKQRRSCEPSKKHIRLQCARLCFDDMGAGCTRRQSFLSVAFRVTDSIKPGKGD